MKRVIKIKGLDCPNCAKVLEKEINKIDIVDNAIIDFLRSTITFDTNNIDDAIEKIIKVTKEIEPDAKIVIDSNINKKSILLDFLLLIFGIIFIIISFIFELERIVFLLFFLIGIILLGCKTYYKAINLLIKGIVNENLLLTISVFGAILLNEYLEAGMVICLYSIGKILESLALNKSKSSIEKLIDLQPEYANILRGRDLIKVNPNIVKVGETLIVKPGERVPIDGIVIDGEAIVDTKSLTGESLPIEIHDGDEIVSGSIVLDKVLKIKTTREYSNSTIKKIMNLIEKAHDNKSKTETWISKITRWYTLGVLCCSILTMTIVLLMTKDINESIYRGLVFLVISCPCAFAISVPLTYFSGIGNASKHGILIKGSNYLDILGKIDQVAFDKTGTLTKGEFVIKDIKVFNKYSKEEIIYLASIGEQYSSHPLAKAIVKANVKELDNANNIEEVAGKGVYYSYNNCNYFIGKKDNKLIGTMVELYENGKLIAQIELVDEVKDSSILVCKNLKELQISTVLLSGDSKESVDHVSELLLIDKSYSDLMPQDKYNFIENSKKNNCVGYVGDGINDAPSLILADIGISMGISGSDASIDASDIVIVDDDPNKVFIGIKIARYTRRIVWENILFSFSIKLLFLVLGALGISGMVSAVFADVGVTLLVILNSMRALFYSANKKTLNKDYKLV